MPLTPKGKKILRHMQEEYGAEKGRAVFYASINKGRLKGAEAAAPRRSLGETPRRRSRPG